MIEKISHKKKVFGYLLRYKKKLGVNFLTPKNLTHQIGFIKHKSKHLINIFMNSFENLDKISKKNIIKNHPDLGNKLKIDNNLTTLSKNEQENVGLNKCTPEEYDFFHKMNNEFKLKFDIPFIFAVKGSNKNIIIEEFKRRLLNDDVNKEFEESAKQVKKIALFRLEDSIDE